MYIPIWLIIIGIIILASHLEKAEEKQQELEDRIDELDNPSDYDYEDIDYP